MTAYQGESPRLHRLQNEVSSKLSGTKVQQANDQGELLLRQLLALAPSADSSSPFLPQPRAVFLYQNFSQWIRSEEAEILSNTVLAGIGQLSTLVAPILQDISGAHWDLMFDIVESILEVGCLCNFCSL